LKDDRVYLQHILDEIEYLISLNKTVTFEELTMNITTEHAITRAPGDYRRSLKECSGPGEKEIPRYSMEIHGRTSQ